MASMCSAHLKVMQCHWLISLLCCLHPLAMHVYSFVFKKNLKTLVWAELVLGILSCGGLVIFSGFSISSCMLFHCSLKNTFPKLGLWLLIS